MDIDHEIKIFVEGMKRLGSPGDDGREPLPTVAGGAPVFDLYEAWRRRGCSELLEKMRSIVVKFGDLFKDDELAGKLEALVGTMKAAKKKGIIEFKGEILLQGAHDNVDVFLNDGN